MIKIKQKIILPVLCVFIALFPCILYYVTESKPISGNFGAEGTIIARSDTYDSFVMTDSLHREFHIFTIDKDTEMINASGRPIQVLGEIPIGTEVEVFHDGKDTRKLRTIQYGALHDQSVTAKSIHVKASNRS